MFGCCRFFKQVSIFISNVENGSQQSLESWTDSSGLSLGHCLRAPDSENLRQTKVQEVQAS